MFPRSLLSSAKMERSSRRTRDEDERRSLVEPVVQCQMPWPPGQVPQGGRLRDDNERALMSPDTTVASKVEAQLGLERSLPVFDGRREQLDAKTPSGKGNGNADGSGMWMWTLLRTIKILYYTLSCPRFDTDIV